MENDQSNWTAFNNGIVYLGTWTSSVRYKLNDVVKYGSGSWICTTPHTSSTTFDDAKFAVFVEGLEFEDSWSSSTTYQIGDVVTYGGYSYIAKRNNSNSNPSTGLNATLDWQVYTTGFNFNGDWVSTKSYKVGDVVRLGGYTYLALTDNTDKIPPNNAYWNQLNSGFKWTNTPQTYTSITGVTVTGIGSGAVQKLDLKQAAQVVKEENERVAKLLGINAAARCTTIKPSGTSSLTLGTSSGIHAWHNDYYIRRIRVGKNEAIYSYLAINHPELVEDEYFRPHDTAVISVPQKAPQGAIYRTESAMDLLERVKFFYQNWIKPGHRSGQNTHNISATVSIKEDEWETVGKWMWENRKFYNGLSVLPFSEHTYIQSPFEDCTKEKYEELIPHLHSVDLSKVVELQDNTDLKAKTVRNWLSGKRSGKAKTVRNWHSIVTGKDRKSVV